MLIFKFLNLIKKLNPILRSFANYYQKAVSDKTFSYVKSRLWEYIWKWCTRRHQKQGTYSPFDAELKEYWEERQVKQGKSQWAKGSKHNLVAKQQNWKCPNCGESLFNGKDIETHQIVPVKDGSSDDTENLTHRHKACHKQEHSKIKSKAGSMA